MVTHLLGTEDIDRDLEELILEKTEGVPFFIEEFIKSLKDLQVIERKDNTYGIAKNIQTVTIPSMIQDVIMARVDSLPGAAKGVLQAGSVIGREFSYHLIKRVTGLSERELLSYMSALKDSELLFERGIFPDSTYIFKHALTHEVVYGSILTRRKKKLHEEIGNAIEKIYKDNLDEYYGVLAEHFINSENYEKGAGYSRLAGKKARKKASLNDSIAYAEKRIACFERLSQTDEVSKQLIDARTTLGLYMLQMAHFIEAKEAIDPIIDLALKRDYKRRLSQIYTIIGAHNHWVEEDFPEAFKHLEDALKIAEELGDVPSVLFANSLLGLSLSENCEFEKASHCLGKALNINVEANSLWGISQGKSHISYYVYNHQGRVNLAYETSDDALRIAEESADTYSKAIAYPTHGISCYGKGFLEEAEKYLMKGIDFCERINLSIWNARAAHYSGEAYFETGKYQKAVDHYENAIGILERTRLYPSLLRLSKIALAKAKVMNNDKNIDLESLYAYVAENRLKVFDGRMRRYIGETLLNIDDQHMPRAEDWIKKAIEADNRNGMMLQLGRDYALYAELFKRKSDQSKAKENLTKAIEIYKDCGADGWLKKLEKELASLS
jgi:tetratricopeptide (TPR) repeat protein